MSPAGVATMGVIAGAIMLLFIFKTNNYPPMRGSLHLLALHPLSNLTLTYNKTIAWGQGDMYECSVLCKE